MPTVTDPDRTRGYKYVGQYPNKMKMPTPMKSFLHQYDLSGEIVIPFNTNAGYGVGTGFQTVRELCPHSKVLEGFETRGGIERDGIKLAIEDEKATEAETQVRQWLQRILHLS